MLTPVAWTPERERRGASTRPPRPRCPHPGCAVRYVSGPDRPCPDHAPPKPELTARQRAMVRAALAIARTPGRRRAVRSLLRDPARSNREVAGEVRTGHMLVTAVRHEMEAAGLIRLYRSTSRAGIRRATPLQVRIRAALLADPARSNRVVAGEAETNHLRVTAVRHAMEAAGLIPVYRARGGPRK